MMTRRLMKFTPSSLRTMWRMMTLGTVSSGKKTYLQNISVNWNCFAKSSHKVLICPKGIIFQAVMTASCEQSKSKFWSPRTACSASTIPSISCAGLWNLPSTWGVQHCRCWVNVGWWQPPNSYRLTSNLCGAVTHFKLEQVHLPPKAPVSVRRTRSFSTSTWVIADRGESSTRGLQSIRAVHLGYIYIYDISGSISRSCTPNFWQELAPGSEGARWWQAPCHPESGQRAGG